MKKIIIIGLGIALIFGLFLGTKSLRTNPNITSFQPKTDQLVSPKVTDLSDTLKLAGSIDALSVANLHFQTAGQLTWVGVKVGDSVKKYQALASLDRRQLQKQIELQSNNYKTALSQFLDTESKYQETKDKYLLTDEIRRILERNQNQLNSSVVNYELSELAARYSTLTTPIAGVVTKIDEPAAGVNITPTATFQVIDPNSLFFSTELDQEDLSRVDLGLPAVISLDSYSNLDIGSSVSYISFAPIPGQSNIVYQVRFNLNTLDNQDLKLRLGLTGDATITLSTLPQVLTIPLEALVSENDAYFVWKKIKNNTYTKTPITTGLETDKLVEVKSGLSPNDQIIIRTKI